MSLDCPWLSAPVSGCRWLVLEWRFSVFSDATPRFSASLPRIPGGESHLGARGGSKGVPRARGSGEGDGEGEYGAGAGRGAAKPQTYLHKRDGRPGAIPGTRRSQQHCRCQFRSAPTVTRRHCDSHSARIIGRSSFYNLQRCLDVVYLHCVACWHTTSVNLVSCRAMKSIKT